MSTILDMLRTLKGTSGYFLPLLLLGLFLLPRQCWKNNRTALVLGIGSCCLLALSLLLGRSHLVSRYFFVPIFLCSFFAGGGLAGYLSKFNPSRRTIVLWVVCIVICGSTALQIGLRDRKTYIPQLAQKISEWSTCEKPIVLYSDLTDAKKIVDCLTRKMSPCELINVRPLEKKTFLIDLPLHYLNEYDVYLLAGIPKQQSAEDWRKELQSCCYLTPFDLVAESVYRKRRLLLWRFNGKIGGTSSASITSLPKTFPAEINFPDNQKLYKIRICDFDMLKAGKSHLFSYSDWYHVTMDNYLQHYFTGEIGDQITFSCCNEYYWPQAIVSYQKTGPDTLKQNQTLVFDNNILPADDPMLFYPVGRAIYPENFSPNWSAFAVNQYTGKEYTIAGTENAGKFTGRMIHNESQRSVNFEIPVIRQNLDILEKQQLNILWLANRSSNPIDVSEHVAALADTVTVNRCLTDLFITSYNSPSQDIASITFPEFQPDILMLDIFANYLSDKSFFEFNREDFFDKLNETLILLKEKFPNCQVMFLLPPVPAKRESQLPRYRLSWLMQEFVNLHPANDIWLIDSVGAVGQDRDFSKITDPNLYSAPVVLSEEGKEKTAQVVLAHLAHFLNQNDTADSK